MNSQELEERLLDFVSHNLPGGIVAVLDEPGLPIVCFNRTLLDYTESTYEDLMRATGGFYEKLIYEGDREMVAREIKKQLAAKDSYEVYYRIVDSRGNLIWVYDLGRYAVNETGKRYSLKLNTLKLDRRLVDDIWRDRKARVVVENIIDVCSKLGIECVAEGVETREQLEILKNMNCDIYQGYYINKPMPTDEFERLYIFR